MSNTLQRENSRILSFWLPPALAERLAELARQEDRSVSAEIRRALREHVEQEWELRNRA